MRVAHVLLVGLVLVGAVLHQTEQPPAEGGALVAADVVQGAVALLAPLRLGGAECLVVAPALEQGVRDGEVLQEAVAPLPAADGPLAGVLAQHRAGVQRQVLRQRLVQVLGQHIDVLRVEVCAARRQQDVEAELPLVARKSDCWKTSERPSRLPAPNSAASTARASSKVSSCGCFFSMPSALRVVAAIAVRQRQHDEVLRVGLQVGLLAVAQRRLDDGQFLAVAVAGSDGAVGAEDLAVEHLVGRHLDDPALGQPAVLREDVMDDGVGHRLAVGVLAVGGPCGTDGDGALGDQLQVGAAGQVLRRGDGPRHGAGELQAMEAADGAPCAEAEVGVEVQQRLAVADDALADAGRQGALVGVAAAPSKSRFFAPTPRTTTARKSKRSSKFCTNSIATWSESLRELLEDIFAGRKRMKIYRQFKMYNDPTLNRYLYNASAARRATFSLVD